MTSRSMRHFEYRHTLYRGMTSCLVTIKQHSI